jgi:hypothetical protein
VKFIACLGLAWVVMQGLWPKPKKVREKTTVKMEGKRKKVLFRDIDKPNLVQETAYKYALERVEKNYPGVTKEMVRMASEGMNVDSFAIMIQQGKIPADRQKMLVQVYEAVAAMVHFGQIKSQPKTAKR